MKLKDFQLAIQLGNLKSQIENVKSIADDMSLCNPDRFRSSISDKVKRLEKTSEKISQLAQAMAEDKDQPDV